MRAHPQPLPRPLVIIGGFGDPNFSPPLYAHFFQTVSSHPDLIPVSVCFCGSFAECRQKVLDAVEKAHPSPDPTTTIEVDVVGASLGGLVARYAAAPPPEGAASPRRLRIARLFSISSPHTGADLADAIALTQFHRDLRTNSPFLQHLAQSDPGARYELYPYVLLNDEIVGESHAAPPSQTPLWLPDSPLFPSHGGAMLDPRILADISRRLRGEMPFSHPPSAPLPPKAPGA
jgi:pimeloyl-ACP methyl ester carboxylesterase